MPPARAVRTVVLSSLIVLCGLSIPLVSPAPVVSGDSGERPAPGSVRTVESPSVTYVDSCTTITESGVYVLTADFGASAGLSQSCLRVEASGVVVDGGGHALEGRGVSDTTGIAVNGTAGATNVTVRNVSVARFNRGVAVVNSSDIVLSNITASDNAYGVTLENTVGVRITGNNISRNVVGIRLTNASDTRIVDNTLSQNQAARMVFEHEREEMTPFDDNLKKTTTLEETDSATADETTAGAAITDETTTGGRDRDDGDAYAALLGDRVVFGASVLLTVFVIFAFVWRYRGGDV